MFTIKYLDRDGIGRFSTGRDIRVIGSGSRVQSVSWVNCDSGEPNTVDFPSTVYLMNDAGATVGKYVVIGQSAADSSDSKWDRLGDQRNLKS